MDAFGGSIASDNLFLFTPSNLAGTDTLTGNPNAGFVDTLTLTAIGTVSAAQLAGTTGIEIVRLTGLGNTLELTLAMANTSMAPDLRVVGQGGNDTVTAALVTNGTRSITFDTRGGNDTLTGGAGADRFVFDVINLDASDVVHGGAGRVRWH